MPARTINLILGVWLLVSAVLWRHGYAQLVNTVLVGALCVLFSLLAMKLQGARYLTTALSVWLFVSAFALPVISSWTVWNNALVAIVLFVLSLIGGDVREWRGREPRAV